MYTNKQLLVKVKIFSHETITEKYRKKKPHEIP